MSIKKDLEASINKMQPLIENTLGVKIGEVEVIPLTSGRMRESRRLLMAGLPEGVTTVIDLSWPVNYISSITSEMSGMLPHFSSRPGQIWYSRSPALHYFFRKDNSLDYAAAHELSHLAHLKILGVTTETIDDMFNVPSEISEGFAEHVSHEVIMREFPDYRLYETYPEMEESFVDALKKGGLTIYDGEKFNKFLREISDVDKNKI